MNLAPSKRLGRFLLLSAALAVTAVAGGTAWIAYQTPQVHAALMQQLAGSGLAREQASDFEPGWLQSLSTGRIRLAQALCGGCDELVYSGAVKQGLGAWLAGDLALVSLDYQLEMPALPIQPGLPPVALSARQSLGPLQADFSLPAGEHEHGTDNHRYRIGHQGLSGELRPGRLQARSEGLTVHRDEDGWLNLTALDLQAAADKSVDVQASADSLQVPLWDWQAQSPSIQYRQQANGSQLNLNLDVSVPEGQVGDAAMEQALDADLNIERLDLPATRAFVEKLPGLMSPKTPAAARMFGLLSLYSLHGPAFFASAPQLDLKAEALPLSGGPGDIDIALAVTPGTRRPPMHPQEWRRALSGTVDITAPRQHLARWWSLGGELLSLVTSLPRDYAALMQAGWVEPQADGRDRLRFRLDQGPRRLASTKAASFTELAHSHSPE